MRVALWARLYLDQEVTGQCCSRGEADKVSK